MVISDQMNVSIANEINEISYIDGPMSLLHVPSPDKLPVVVAYLGFRHESDYHVLSQTAWSVFIDSADFVQLYVNPEWNGKDLPIYGLRYNDNKANEMDFRFWLYEFC